MDALKYDQTNNTTIAIRQLWNGCVKRVSGLLSSFNSYLSHLQSATIFGVQGRSRSSMLATPESSSPVMDESADARRILTAVPQSDWRRPVGWPHSSWMATLKNDLSLHNLTFEDAIEMALDKPLWWLLAASGAMHWWCMPNNDDDDDNVPLRTAI